MAHTGGPRGFRHSPHLPGLEPISAHPEFCSLGVGEQVAWERNSAPHVQRPSGWGSRKKGVSVSVTPVFTRFASLWPERLMRPQRGARGFSPWDSLVALGLTWAEHGRGAARLPVAGKGERSWGRGTLGPPVTASSTTSHPPVTTRIPSSQGGSGHCHCSATCARPDRSSGDTHMHPNAPSPLPCRERKGVCSGRLSLGWRGSPGHRCAAVSRPVSAHGSCAHPLTP